MEREVIMGHSPQCSGRTPPRTTGWDSQRALLRKPQRTQALHMSERPLGQDHSRWQEQRWESTAKLSASVASAGGPGRPWDTRLARWEMAGPAMPGEPWDYLVFTPRTVGTSEGF